MKKTIYLLLALLGLVPNMATEKVTTSLLVASSLVLSGANSKHTFDKKRSFDLYDLDEKQVLNLIIDNYLRERGRIKMQIPNELQGLIHEFFIYEWTILGLHKETGTGYDPHGFDIKGIHKGTKNDLDLKGFRQNGDYKDVNPTTGKPTKYDPEGYDIDRWNKHGLHENGRMVDDHGFAQHVSHASMALYEAIENVDIKAVGLLLKHADVNVNLKDKKGYTPLILCCKRGDESLEIAKSLLGHPNIDVNLKDKYGETPLIVCCWQRYASLEIAKLLLGRNEINVNLQNNYGNTPLIVCCWQRYASLEITKLLLGRNEINVNLQNNYGHTPLIVCCWQGDKSLEIGKLLVKHKNIDVNLPNNNSHTPLDEIIQNVLEGDEDYEYVNLWNVLVGSGAKLNQYKTAYKKMNPNNFKEPQKTYVAWIKKNSSRNSTKKNFMENNEGATEGT